MDLFTLDCLDEACQFEIGTVVGIFGDQLDGLQDLLHLLKSVAQENALLQDFLVRHDSLGLRVKVFFTAFARQLSSMQCKVLLLFGLLLNSSLEHAFSLLEQMPLFLFFALLLAPKRFEVEERTHLHYLPEQLGLVNCGFNCRWLLAFLFANLADLDLSCLHRHGFRFFFCGVGLSAHFVCLGSHFHFSGELLVLLGVLTGLRLCLFLRDVLDLIPDLIDLLINCYLQRLTFLLVLDLGNRSNLSVCGSCNYAHLQVLRTFLTTHDLLGLQCGLHLLLLFEQH